MKKGETKWYKTIEEFAEDNDYSMEELGKETVGESFIVLKHNEKDLTISFVLVSSGSNGFNYECIYSDLK